MLNFTFSRSVDNLFNRLKTIEGARDLTRRLARHVRPGMTRLGQLVAEYVGAGHQYGNAILVFYGAVEFRHDTIGRRLDDSQHVETNVLTVVKMKHGFIKGKPCFIEW